MKLSQSFTAKLEKKIRGTVDGLPLRTSFMALGDGRHKLPVKGDILMAVRKKAGDPVTIMLEKRILKD